MIVKCPDCSIRFRVPDDAIKPSGSKVRCSRCKAVFRVYPDTGGATVAQVVAGSTQLHGADEPSTGATIALQALASGETRIDGVSPDAYDATELDDSLDPDAVFGEAFGDGDPFTNRPDTQPEETSQTAQMGAEELETMRTMASDGLPEGHAGQDAPGGFGGLSGLHDLSADQAGGDEEQMFGGLSGLQPLDEGGKGAGDDDPFPQAPSMLVDMSRSGGTRALGAFSLEGFAPSEQDEPSEQTFGDPERARQLMEEQASGEVSSYGGDYFDAGGGSSPFDAPSPASGSAPKGIETTSWDEGEDEFSKFDGELDLDLGTDEEDDPWGADGATENVDDEPATEAPARSTPTAGVRRASRPPTLVGQQAPTVQVRPSRAAPVLGTILLVIIGVLAVGGYVAHQNDGLLDFKEIDQMLGVAFEDAEYEPRHVRFVEPAAAGSGAVVAEQGGIPAQLERGNRDLVVTETRTGHYRTEDEVDLILIEGNVLNQDPADGVTYRAATVRVALAGPEGEELATVYAPAGARVEQPSLETISSAEDRAVVYDEIERLSSELQVAADEQTPFTAVFIRDPGWDSSALTYRATVASAQKSDPAACWVDLTYIDEPGQEGSGDAAALGAVVEGSGEPTPTDERE